MVTASKTGPQDMPPPGGYSPIQTARIRLKPILSVPILTTAFVASQVIGWYLFYKKDKLNRKHDIEMESAKFVLSTFLQAERDREYLKNLRRNRDYERELMKNNPDWKVGTFYGEPIFETINTNEEWYDPKIYEYYIHSHPDAIDEKARVYHWS